MKKYKGFTLIELIIVIVILGILAAYAVPKYINIEKDARVAVLKGLDGSIRTAANLVHAVAIIRGKDDNKEVILDNDDKVKVTDSLYPTADTAGIIAALSDIEGFENDDIKDKDGKAVYKKEANKIKFWPKGISKDNIEKCSVTYDITGSSPDITMPSGDDLVCS